MRAYATLLAALSILFASFATSAQHSVKITFNAGYRLPSELAQVNVIRTFGGNPDLEQSIDQYFASIRKILADSQVAEQWGSVVIDSSFVEIDIVLDAKHLRFANSYFAGTGIGFRIETTENDRHVAAALQKILNLTIEHVSGKLSAKRTTDTEPLNLAIKMLVP